MEPVKLFVTTIICTRVQKNRDIETSDWLFQKYYKYLQLHSSSATNKAATMQLNNIFQYKPYALENKAYKIDESDVGISTLFLSISYMIK